MTDVVVQYSTIVILITFDTITKQQLKSISLRFIYDLFFVWGDFGSFNRSKSRRETK